MLEMEPVTLGTKQLSEIVFLYAKKNMTLNLSMQQYL